MKAGDIVDFVTSGGFKWDEPFELFYGKMINEDHLFIYRKDTDKRARPLGTELGRGWCFLKAK